MSIYKDNVTGKWRWYTATPTGQGKHTSRRKEDFLQNEKR